MKHEEPPTLLVIEDDEELRRLMKLNHGLRGFRVETAAYEEDAVRVARLNPPDIILIEMGGPARRMLETAVRVREAAGLPIHTTIIVYANRPDELAAEGREVAAGLHEFVILPVDSEQLEEFISGHMAREKKAA